VPLNVSIAINGRPITQITIGRMEELKGKDRFHEYLIRVEGEPEHYATFMHNYADGAEECVRRGLEALAEKRSILKQASPR
jgi:hypothetical protein